MRSVFSPGDAYTIRDRTIFPRGRFRSFATIILCGVACLLFAGCDEGDSDQACEDWKVREIITRNGSRVFFLGRASPRKATYIKYGGSELEACREANRKFGFEPADAGESNHPAGAHHKLSASAASEPAPFIAFNQYALDALVTGDGGDAASDYVAAVFEGEHAVTIIPIDGGHFLSPVKFPTGVNPRVVRAGDVNGDGKLDLLTANSGAFTGADYAGGDVSLLLGNGDGAFQSAISIPGGQAPWDAELRDFNQDRKLDLVVADAPVSSAQSIAIRLGNGDGTFQPPSLIETPAQALAVVDLNVDVDDRDDIVTSGSILLGRGDGTFAPAVNFPLGFNANVNVVKVADLNGDRKPDVIVGSIDRQMVSVFPGNGDGTLAAPRHYRVSGPTEEIQVTDRNGDGAADILVSNASGGGARLQGNGDGTFQAAEIYFVVNHSLGATGAAAADFTGDGVPDLVVANGGYWQGSLGNPILGGATAVLMRGLGEGRFGSPEPIPEQPGSRVEAGDWNGDGRQDLVFAGRGNVKMQLFIALGRGDGTFAPAPAIDLPGPQQYAGNALVTAFVNGDDTPDLLVANFDGTVSVFLGNGQGGFVPQPAVPIDVGPNSIASGDLNGDRKLDIAVTHLGGFGELNGGVKIALGNGDGTFATVQTVRTNASPDSVSMGDFNGDGKMDLAVSLEVSRYEWDVEIFLGNGDGTFGAPSALGLSDSFVTGVAAADFDLDGKPDLAVSEGGSRALGLRGKGDGTFESVLSGVIGGGRMIVADLDGDGFPDMFSPSQNGFMAVLRNPAVEVGFVRPALQYRYSAGGLELTWPGLFKGFSVWETDDLSAPVWRTSTNTVNIANDRFQTIIEMIKGSRFFRLEKTE